MRISRPFRFKQFLIVQERTPMKVGTDGVLLGAWADIPAMDNMSGCRKQHILDVGTGTGLVALMMAQRFPEADVKGIDILDEAVAEASMNVANSQFSHRVRVEKHDFCTFSTACCQPMFDAIVCNPPYFEKSLKCPDSGRSAARHNDSLSLDNLIAGSGKILRNKGILNIIIPYSQTDEAITIASEYGFVTKRAMRIRGNVNSEWKRALLSFELGGEACEYSIEELTLESERNIRTSEYKKLTEGFYLIEN